MTIRMNSEIVLRMKTSASIKKQSGDFSLSNSRCKGCGALLNTHTIHNVVRCPNCGTLNE